MQTSIATIENSREIPQKITNKAGHSMPVIPALWEAKMGRSLGARSSRPAWPTWQNPISVENTKISWGWWCMAVVPATWEAEAQELFEHGRQRLKWAESLPLHSSLGNRARLCLKSKTERSKTKHNKSHKFQLLSSGRPEEIIQLLWPSVLSSVQWGQQWLLS